MNQETKDAIFEKCKAGFPAIQLITSEDQRAVREVKEAAQAVKRPFYIWTLSKGLVLDGKVEKDPEFIQNTGAPNQVLDHLTAMARKMKGEMVKGKAIEGAVVMLRVFHSFLTSPQVQALMLDLIPIMKMSKMMVVITAPSQCLPAELEKEFSTVEMKLPSKEMLEMVLDDIMKMMPNLAKPTPEGRKMMIDSAAGLSTSEAENTFSLSVIRPLNLKKPIWDPAVVLEEKVVALRKTGLLEYIPTESFSMQSIGGMRALKDWVSRRKRAFTEEAKQFGLPAPKGILMVGPPGSGKSLGAKAVGAELGIPLIRCDFGKLFGSLVGQSEANMRRALDGAEAMAPCVFWIDEIEKALAGSSGSNDSGVGARLLGNLLTWMQEKTSPVFVYATANDVTGLPPELLRKGRFDEMWSVLLPNDEERKEILQIHLTKRGRAGLIGQAKGKNSTIIDLDELAKETKGFSGAEIEALVNEALYEAFNERREMNRLDMVSATKKVVPLSKTMGQKILALEEWCKTRTRAANGDENSNVKAMIEAVGGRVLEA